MVGGAFYKWAVLGTKSSIICNSVQRKLGEWKMRQMIGNQLRDEMREAHPDQAIGGWGLPKSFQKFAILFQISTESGKCVRR